MFPSKGEITSPKTSLALVGSARDLPSHSTRHNYHHAVVIDLNLNVFESTITLTVFPMPAYSASISGSWLLANPPTIRTAHPSAI